MAQKAKFCCEGRRTPRQGLVKRGRLRAEPISAVGAQLGFNVHAADGAFLAGR